MKDFFSALVSQEKNRVIPEEFNYFGKLIGSWQIDYVESHHSRVIKGEWHFSWVLEGMAIQDVIILPDYESGTSLRIYYTGKIIRLEARKQDDMIVLTYIDDETRKWIFTRIEDNQFHWQNITIKDDGDWYVNADIFAKRIL